jgi:4-amino-4-deoxy-L-arabinose transferase-like glycosyltransferase
MGTAALTDMPVTFFFLLALFLIDRLARRASLLLSIAAGVAIGLGLLSKYTMLLIYPVLFCYIFGAGSFRRVCGHLAVSVLVSAIVLGAWLAFAYRQGILAAQAETVSGYAGVVTGGRWRYMVEMISTELTSAVGLYNLPLVLWGILHCVNSRSKPDLLVMLWILPVFAIVTLTLPDPRYFMPAFPALAIAMARKAQVFRESASRIVVLAILLCGGALYLFADWYRAAFLFLQ